MRPYWTTQRWKERIEDGLHDDSLQDDSLQEIDMNKYEEFAR